jgi:phosphoglycerol transferase MdoB-like AlkP superfamily enzyme
MHAANHSEPVIETPSNSGSELNRESKTPYLFWYLLIIFWVAELFCIQHLSIIRTYYPLFYAGKVGIRLLLDATLITAVCLLFPRKIIAAVFVGFSLFELVTVSFSSFFGRSISYFIIANQWKEGAKVADGGLAELSLSFLAIIIATFIVKLALLIYSKRPELKWQWRYSFVMVLLVGYCGCVAALNHKLELLKRSVVMYETGDVAFITGYLPAWFGEYYYTRDPDFFYNHAMKVAEDLTTDNLTHIASPLPESKHFIAIQFESVGIGCLDKKINGKELTPFLNKLAKNSTSFEMEVYHECGSADSDFAFLTSKRPNGMLMPYKVPRFPWKFSWVNSLNNQGYETAWFNAFKKDFFARDMPYKEMGFNRRFCQEDMGGKNPRHKFGLYTDRDLYRESLKCIEEDPNKRVFHFIISATSHTPYTMEDPEQRIIYTDPKTTEENYLNSIRFTDASFEEYYNKLPEGSLLILYGDHTVHYCRFDEEDDDKEYTPCIVHIKGKDVRFMNEKNSDLLKGFSIVDIGGYVNSSVLRWGGLSNSPKAKMK